MAALRLRRTRTMLFAMGMLFQETNVSLYRHTVFSLEDHLGPLNCVSAYASQRCYMSDHCLFFTFIECFASNVKKKTSYLYTCTMFESISYRTSRYTQCAGAWRLHKTKHAHFTCERNCLSFSSYINNFVQPTIPSITFQCQ